MVITGDKILMMGHPADVSAAVGMKHDEAKPRFDLIPPMAELEVAKVLEYGASKYDTHNWRYVENPQDRYLAAARRHINAWMQNEPYDDESGLPHLAHAITSLMFILELELEQ